MLDSLHETLKPEMAGVAGALASKEGIYEQSTY
jgi:hypothetical protein